MSNYTDLKTQLQARVTELNFDSTDPQKYEALALIDQYVAALEKQATETASNITAYSISGRSVTKTQGGSGDYMAIVSRLKRQLYSILYGGIMTRVDFRTKAVNPQRNAE